MKLLGKQMFVLNIEAVFLGMRETTHPVVLRDDRYMILVDGGYTGYLGALEHAMGKQGLDSAQLTHMFITHHDHDHMGIASALKEKYPHIQIVTGEIEAPYVSGEKKSLRLIQAEALQPTLPKEHQAFGEAFCAVLRNVVPVPVDMTVRDGDVLDWCGGCRVIATHGHTPGHISLYSEKEKILITGDAAALENGGLVIANPQFTLDMRRAEESLEKIRRLGAETIICYHGGVYRVINANQKEGTTCLN